MLALLGSGCKEPCNSSLGDARRCPAPDEIALGSNQGYPIGTPSNWFYEESVRVGSFSHRDTIHPYALLEKSATPSPLRKTPSEPPLRYAFEAKSYSIDDFLSRQRITGLLLIKDGEILIERYQYDRRDTHRFTSNSMAKSIVSLAIGMALDEGKIASLDDRVAKYVPELAGRAYGETTLRNLLRMASGVRFREDYSGRDDLRRFASIWHAADMVEAFKAFNQRNVEPGSTFRYDSAQGLLAGLVVRGATGQSLAEYLTHKLWQPMGAEADATWIIDRQGVEWSAGNFNAVLRDYGRLGMLLANDGMLAGRQIVPRDYLLQATDWRRHPPAFAPGAATSLFGYGYLFWILPGESRQFAMIGAYGQMMYIDPARKLVLVHTGVAKNGIIFQGDPMGPESLSLWAALVETYSNSATARGASVADVN